jgi:hypothetical protein
VEGQGNIPAIEANHADSDADAPIAHEGGEFSRDPDRDGTVEGSQQAGFAHVDAVAANHSLRREEADGEVQIQAGGTILKRAQCAAPDGNGHEDYTPRRSFPGKSRRAGYRRLSTAATRGVLQSTEDLVSD